MSRIECRSENYETDLTLDINSVTNGGCATKRDAVRSLTCSVVRCSLGCHSQEIYPIDIGEKFAFALASTINADGTPDDGYYTQSTQETLADKHKFEYVMHGKVFKCESAANKRLAVYASFGGLLMKLEGDPRNLHEIVPDERIYLMIRKTL